MARKKVTFNLDNENRPILETINISNIDGLFFSEQYKYALSILDSNLQDLGRFASDTDLNSSLQLENPNNIIAFAGERGTGKTSCMISLANMLLDYSRRKDFTDYPNVAKQTYFHIGMIDPSYFDDNHNIVSLFLAKMFKAFREKSDLNINEGYSDDKMKLMECFSDAQRHLNILMEKPNSNEDDLGELVELSASIDLRVDIYNLVNAFRKYSKLEENSRLLLIIDDIDLNTGEAGKMAELIRKYFVQPNITVLLSLKVDQLEMIKRLDYTKQYKLLLEKGTLDQEIETMVERYIAKFLPSSQRVFLPNPDVYLNSEVVLESSSFKHPIKFRSVKQAVPELIFTKTRFLFYNTEQKTSYIVPRNLRELRQLVRLLALMPDYHSYEMGKLIINENNKSIFLRYLFEIWVLNNIQFSDRKWIKDIWNEESYVNLNSLSMKYLIEKFGPIYDNTELVRLNEDANVSYNISVGDVLGLIYHMESLHPEIENQKFLFIFKTIYSIKLYEAYDNCTEFDIIQNKNEEKNLSIFKYEQLDNLNDYEQIVAGSHINTLLSNFPSVEGMVVRRSIDLKQLNDLIKHCLEYWESAKRQKLVALAEFFMLCVSRPIESTNRTDNDDFYRTKKVLYYNEAMFPKLALFDVGSFFFNAMRIARCYSRFIGGKTLWDNVDKLSVSDTTGCLWAEFKKRTIENKVVGKKRFTMNRWLSYCCFRNVEILQDFINYLEQPQDMQSSDDVYVLARLFDRMSKYYIKSYDKKDDDYYKIEFGFTEVVASLLKEISDNPYSELASWFHKIYDMEKSVSKNEIIQ